MKRKITAALILLLTYFFPFRNAFLEGRWYDGVSGAQAEHHPAFYLFNFVLVLLGIALFNLVKDSDKGSEPRIEDLEQEKPGERLKKAA